MATTWVTIEISESANKKAWAIRESLSKKRIKVGVRDVYSMMLEMGVDKVNEKSFDK